VNTVALTAISHGDIHDERDRLSQDIAEIIITQESFPSLQGTTGIKLTKRPVGSIHSGIYAREDFFQ